MRVFALLLLLLNIGYFFWHSGLLRDNESRPVLVRSPSREAPQSLRLLGEVRSTEAAAVPAGQSCVSIGVFDGAAEGGRFAGQLQALGYPASIELVETGEQPDYRVYMPPFDSPGAARRRLEELREQDIESYLIADGEPGEGISLGLFSRRESARQIQEELAERGYRSVAIREEPRSRTGIWVHVAGLPEEGFAEGWWTDFVNAPEGLKQQEKLCETIAPKA